MQSETPDIVTSDISGWRRLIVLDSACFKENQNQGGNAEMQADEDVDDVKKETGWIPKYRNEWKNMTINLK